MGAAICGAFMTITRLRGPASQLERASFAEEVSGILKEISVPPSSLVLEVTESFLLGDVTSMLERLEHPKSLGVRLAIDDFGTGYSSLSRLRASLRHPQDRQVVRRYRRRCQRRDATDAGDHRPWEDAQHADGGRRHRTAAATQRLLGDSSVTWDTAFCSRDRLPPKESTSCRDPSFRSKSPPDPVRS